MVQDYTKGYDDGFDEGYAQGYDEGRTEGHEEPLGLLKDVLAFMQDLQRELIYFTGEIEREVEKV